MSESSDSSLGNSICIGPPEKLNKYASSERVALVAIHGMGQQLPFETIDDALEGIYGPQTTATVRNATAAHVDIQNGRGKSVQGDLEPRLRLDVNGFDANGEQITVGVDVYEVHWSDYTSKAASALETYWFLLATAVAGIAFKIVPHRFTKPYVRWVDGQERKPHIPFGHAVALAVALLDVLALGAIGASFLAVVFYRAAAIVIELRDIEWLLEPMQSTVNTFFLVEGVSGFILAMVWLIETQRPMRANRSASRSRGLARLTARPVLWLFATAFGWLFFLAPALTIITAIGYSLGSWSLGWHISPAFFTGWPVPETIVWTFGLAGYLLVQHFLTEYVGDVAIYMSSHRVSRFHCIRESILKRSRRTLQGVLGLEYHHVVVAAHSLGSVIAYDTINAIFLSQLAATGNCAAQKVHLVTYGSPLRKRAFLMRKVGSESPIRAALIGASQPTIAFPNNGTARFKLASWTNVWSRQDWISGELTKDTFGFDQTATAPRYRNVCETDLSVPLLSHLNYKSGRAVPEAIIEAILAGIQ